MGNDVCDANSVESVSYFMFYIYISNVDILCFFTMANRFWAICLELMLEVTAILTTLEPGALWSDLAKYRAGLRERERVEPGPGPHMSPLCDQKLALSSFRVQLFFSGWHRLLVLIELCPRTGGRAGKLIGNMLNRISIQKKNVCKIDLELTWNLI